MSEDQIMNCGWHGTIHTFLLVSETQWKQALIHHHYLCMHTVAERSQIAAWSECFTILHEQLTALCRTYTNAEDWYIVFEYELPRERGRRPDVLILTPHTIFVIEFKGYNSILQAHIDQVAAYTRDLQHYHAASHSRPAHSLLVLTQTEVLDIQRDEVWIVSPDQLGAKLPSLIHPLPASVDAIVPEHWLRADYAPLPSLVNAARTLFQHEPLPYIRRAHSAGIPDAIAALVSISEQAYKQSELHLALITGVPGAGKTLVGLQFVYEHHFNTVGSQRPAVFLSGNGPLVKVLQYALKNRIFVQDVHGFLRDYGGQQKRPPEEHIWVYDEAQRAWDADKVREKRGEGVSEPEDFLRIGERMQSWAMVVGLIGEGQEIHLGEEAGIEQWNTAISNVSCPWTVHCPPKLASVFSAAAEVHVDAKLDLTISLRSHIAEYVQDWVKCLLAGAIDKAGAISQNIRKQGFDMYITQNIEAAKDYVKTRYQMQVEKRYGLLASSKAKNLSQYGIQNDYNYTKNLREGPWYNDAPESSQSCCQLHEVATEFACQGLELDFPIVGWGNDLLWAGQRWQSIAQPRSRARDPHLLRLNSYRVLLSRGRDGFVVFVPPESNMVSTYRALEQAGLRPLDELVQKNA